MMLVYRMENVDLYLIELQIECPLLRLHVQLLYQSAYVYVQAFQKRLCA